MIQIRGSVQNSIRNVRTSDATINAVNVDHETALTSPGRVEAIKTRGAYLLTPSIAADNSVVALSDAERGRCIGGVTD